MKPEQENLDFEDVAQTLRSAEFRRTGDLREWLREFWSSARLRYIASRGGLERSSTLLSSRHRNSWSS